MPHHIVRGEARSMENIQYHPVFSLPMGIAAGIGGVMLLALLLSLNKRIQFILAAGVTFGVMAFIIIVPVSMAPARAISNAPSSVPTLFTTISRTLLVSDLPVLGMRRL